MKKSYLFLGFFIIGIGSKAFANTKVLTLESYLQAVKAKNLNYQNAKLRIESAGISKDLEAIKHAPKLIVDGLESVSRFPRSVTTQADRLDKQGLRLGFVQHSRYGLSAEGAFGFERNKLSGQISPLVEPEKQEYAASARSQVSVQLWQNAWGSLDQEEEKVRVHTESARIKEQEFKQLMILEQAKHSYWGLALAQKKLAVYQKIRGNAQNLLNFLRGREAKRLVNKIDVHQAISNDALRQLELQRQKMNLSQLTFEFNHLRGLEGSELLETLEVPSTNDLLNISVTENRKEREDLGAKLETKKAAISQIVANREYLKPDLKFFVQLEKKRLDSNISAATRKVWKASNSQTTYGLQFSYLLDRDLVNKSIQASEKLEKSLQVESQANKLENKKHLASLKEHIKLGKDYLQSTIYLEKVEKEKYRAQNKRYKLGQASTDEFLRFEDMYYDAQIVNLDAQINLLMLVTELQTY